jgi:hypothetical protein
LTWEWRTHFGQPASLPTGPPHTLDEIRIAHNVAVERHDAAAAAKWRESIEATLDRTAQTRFEPGVNLLGVRRVGGVQPRLEVWFECTAPLHKDASFNVAAKVEARGRFTLIPPNGNTREMAWPAPLPTDLWRPGYFYKTEIVLNHLIGIERYEGYWSSRDGSSPPKREDRGLITTLAVLP